jgi:hypothetical protein
MSIQVATLGFFLQQEGMKLLSSYLALETSWEMHCN